MPTKIWAAGEELKAADVNTYLSNQAVMVFADAAARTAAIPAPSVGMITYLTSTGYLEVYTSKTSPSSWRPPWNTAWGLTYQTNVTDITLTNTNQQLGPVLPVQLPGRLYKVELDVNIVMNASGAQATFHQWYNGASPGTFGQWTNQASWATRCVSAEIYPGNASNSVTLQVRADFGAATGWGRARVFDVGPV